MIDFVGILLSYLNMFNCFSSPTSLFSLFHPLRESLLQVAYGASPATPTILVRF